MHRNLLTCVCHSALAFIFVSGVGLSKDNVPSVDFRYAFAAPHRITVALPDSSNKTLLDATPGKLEMSWTYEDLIYYSFKSFWTPPTKWKVVIQPQIDGHPFSQSKWERSEGYLPILRNSYHDNGGDLVLEIGGGDTAAITKIRLANSSNRNETMALRCEVPGGLAGYNPAWVDNEKAADHLLAGWGAPADQVVILGIGADENPLPGSTVLTMKWNLKPGESREAWLIRPYKNEESDVAVLRKKNWADEFERAKKEWVDLLDRASRVIIPDQGVSKAFYACLADLFIMREPIAKGYIATIPGTEAYRSAPNPFETAIVAVALDRGAITESDGTRWISAVPGKATGSRYGVLKALFPTGLLSPTDKLIDGTLKYIERNMSPGGIPVRTGWMKDGMWVAITLDNVAEAHLARNEGDVAARLLYATLNHGTPLYTWCEERGQEPNTQKTSGDRQHLWTPVAVVRFLRDALVMEEDDHLHLARGIDRSWLASGKAVGIENASTHFGLLSYHFSLDQMKSKLAGEIDFPESKTPYKAILHCRLPRNFRVVGVDKSSKASLSVDGEALEWDNPRGTISFQARVGLAK
jgi:hypothetical protein